MKRYVIIDPRMRQIEQEYIKKLGYDIIYISKNYNVYSEISSHVDIFCSKVGTALILEPEFFLNFKEYKLLRNNLRIIKGSTYASNVNTAYNACVTSKYAIHNFEYTDKALKKFIKNKDLVQINVNQGYSNCSISVLNDFSFITCDNGIKNELLKYSDIDFLYIDKNDINIKLIRENDKYSNMSGFIGGATCVLGRKFILFGDRNNINSEARQKIINFVDNKKFEFVDFKGLDIIDYGGILEI